MSHPSAESCHGNILIVGPSSKRQTALVQLLAAEGHTVYTVFTLSDVWNLLSCISLRLIFLEIGLGDRSSLDLCRQLKQSRRTLHIPVLFTGQESALENRLQALRAGGVDFIPEPYSVEEVAIKMQLHISLGGSQQGLTGRRPYQTLSRLEHPPLLATLQQTLHRQTVKLQEKNVQLQQEIQEKQLAEEALRQEQQKSEQLLRNILPEAIVAQLKQFQGSLAERFEEATVLFADIVNFTPISAQMSPLDLVNVLNKIFSAFDQLASKHQLEKIKTIGDAYMVVGGLPVPQENHATAVANMALEMLSVIQQFSLQAGEPLQLRIGINTGSVVAGVIGIKKFSYDLWGDTVNIASRMESQGAPGKIQVTEATYNRLKDSFMFEPAQEISVKGIGQMATHYLLGRR